jgi:hypothetical protein
VGVAYKDGMKVGGMNGMNGLGGADMRKRSS